MTTRRNVIFGFGAFALGATSQDHHTLSVSRPGTAFGTTVNLNVTAHTRTSAERALDAGFAEIRAVHKAASLFDSASEISRLNASGRLETPSAILLDIVKLSDDLHGLTQGAFDPSVQPLWSVWAEDRASQALLSQTLTFVGWRKLLVHTGRLQLKAGSALTFNGIAQGYAADRVIAAMQREGAVAADVDTGETGRLNAEGVLKIKHPRKDTVLGTLRIGNGFVAVSGDYASSFSADFLNHHIFDPRRGFSPKELSSVVVTAPSGAVADGLATAFMVMGVAASLDCLRGIKNCAAVFVDKGGAVTLSAGMEKQFVTHQA